MSWLRRIKAMIPIAVAVVAVTLFVRHVQKDTRFAINDIPEKDRNWLEYMLFAGLDRIESAGWEIPLDKRQDRPYPPGTKPAQ